MPPAQIFIARHSERLDRKDPEFPKTYSRPHDPPITNNGVILAEKLGEYLVTHYHIDPAEVVILTSPLLRCVQTSDGIVTGALRAAATTLNSTIDTIPVHLEPAIMEGPKWLYLDMKRNPAIVAVDGSSLHCPDPVYHDAMFHRDNTSRHVQLHNPFPLHTAPVFKVEGNELVDAIFPQRCVQGVKNLLTSPLLDGKTVVLVAHGETALIALHALKGLELEPDMRGPNYTGFVHLMCESSGTEAQVTVEFEPFATPHLPHEPLE